MHRGPYGKYKSNVSEEVLLSTIHMSLWFTVRPFPYVELLCAVLDEDLNREVAGIALSGGGRSPAVVGKSRGASQEPRSPVGLLS